MRDLNVLIEEGVIREDVSLGPLTTYKSGGPARFFADVTDREVLEAVIASGLTKEMPLLVLGRGSNLVVADEGFDGLVLRLGQGFSRVLVQGTEVTAGSAVPLPRLARAAVDAGLAGLEFFVGVPGSVGGAVRQNAGCFGSETKDRLLSATIVDVRSGVARTADAAGLDLSYRHSNLRSQDMVVEATFGATKGDAARGREEMRRITRWRKENQPGGTLNAGSVFKNPPGISAGELIDSLGLKGVRVGDVSVSHKHANFFIAGPKATSQDIRRLVQEVIDRVSAASGTMLEPEIQFVGFEE